MNADVPTLLLMTLISAVVMAAALLLLGWSSRQDGLQFWAQALLLAAAGYALFLLRGRVSDVFSVWLGNALVVASFAFLLAAVRRFYALPVHWPVLLAPAALTVPLMAWGSSDFALRMVLSSAVMLALVLWLLATLARHRDPGAGRGAQLVMAGMALEGTVLLARTIAGAWFVQSGDILQGSPLQTYSFMVAFVGLLVTSMGFVFMGKDRADATNHRLAAQDDLTGLANRRASIAALERDVARAVRTGTPLAVMMVDVDHFKRVNDRWGHQAGDAVLRCVADALRQRVRAQDLVGRYGGEEFLLVLPETTHEGALQLALHLCASVQATPCAWGQDAIPTSVSIGVFAGLLENGQVSGDQLLQAADRALYRAKAAGRNRVEMAPGLGPLPAQSPPQPTPSTTLPAPL